MGLTKDEDTVKWYINSRLTYMIDQESISLCHEAIWGVPCGPTLSMVNPPLLQGIKNFY